jgi:hypothetical protein
MMRGLDVERATLAGISVGLAQAALDHSVAWAREREQFGRPIAEFQMVQKLIADMYVDVEAARLLVYEAAALCVAQAAGCSKLASAAKLFASEIATRAGLAAVQVFGGYGYTRDYPVERIARDAKLMEIGAGTPEISARSSRASSCASASGRRIRATHLREPRDSLWRRAGQSYGRNGASRPATITRSSSRDVRRSAGAVDLAFGPSLRRRMRARSRD